METFILSFLTQKEKPVQEKLAKYKKQNLFGKTKLHFVHNVTTKI